MLNDLKINYCLIKSMYYADLASLSYSYSQFLADYCTSGPWPSAMDLVQPFTITRHFLAKPCYRYTATCTYQLASSPGPLFIFCFEEGPVCKNTSCYITLDRRECVHGDASFHHDIVPECLWPSSSLVRVPE